jgi:hypothetical protein
MTETDQVACSLDGRELKGRLAVARGVGDAALIAHESSARRHMLRFRDSPASLARLERIVEAERRCCSFLSLDLKQDGNALVLSIDAPPGAETTAAGLAAAFTGGSR